MSRDLDNNLVPGGSGCFGGFDICVATQEFPCGLRNLHWVAAQVSGKAEAVHRYIARHFRRADVNADDQIGQFVLLSQLRLQVLYTG